MDILRPKTTTDDEVGSSKQSPFHDLHNPQLESQCPKHARQIHKKKDSGIDVSSGPDETICWDSGATNLSQDTLDTWLIDSETQLQINAPVITSSGCQSPEIYQPGRGTHTSTQHASPLIRPSYLYGRGSNPTLFRTGTPVSDVGLSDSRSSTPQFLIVKPLHRAPSLQSMAIRDSNSLHSSSKQAQWHNFGSTKSLNSTIYPSLIPAPEPKPAMPYSASVNDLTARTCSFCKIWLHRKLSIEEGQDPSAKINGNGKGQRIRKSINNIFNNGVYTFVSPGCSGCKFLETAISTRMKKASLKPGDVKNFTMFGPYCLNRLAEGSEPSDDYESEPQQHVKESASSFRHEKVRAIMEVMVEVQEGKVKKDHLIFNVQFQAIFYENSLKHLGLWVRERFDPVIIRKWLDVCNHQNHPTRFSHNNHVPPIYLIDLDHNRLVPAQRLSTFKYIALSYVWSQAGSTEETNIENHHKHILPGSLATTFKSPSLFGDCASLCRELKVRYLWIDKFCIVQDDKQHTEEQIKVMDAIYSSAYLTLVCALHGGVTDRLPGYIVDRTHDDALMQTFYSPITTRPHDVTRIEYVVNGTRWSTRGWTYQEQVLSQRCLYITNSQIAFDCTCGFAQEMCTWSTHSHNEASNYGMILHEKLCAGATLNNGSGQSYTEDWMPEQNHGGSPLYPASSDAEPPCKASNSPEPWTANGGLNISQLLNHPASQASCKQNNHRFLRQQDFTFDTYAKVVQGYSKRKLTKLSDSLSAFHGILNRLSCAYGQDDIFGLPKVFFVHALFWSREIGLSQRLPRKALANTPSWSWAKWLKPSMYWDFDIISPVNSLQCMYYKPAGAHNYRLNLFNREPYPDWEPTGNLLRMIELQSNVLTFKVIVTHIHIESPPIGSRLSFKTQAIPCISQPDKTQAIQGRFGVVTYDSLESMASIQCEEFDCPIHDDPQKCHIADVFVLHIQIPKTKDTLAMIVKGDVSIVNGQTVLLGERIGMVQGAAVDFNYLSLHQGTEMIVMLM